VSIVFCDRATAFGDIAWLDGEGSDPQIPDGLHWHVTLGPKGGLPAGPTVVVDVHTNVDSFRGLDPTWASRPRPPGGWEIDDEAELDLVLAFSKPAPGDEVLGWFLVQADGELTVAAADPQPTVAGLWSVNAARSQPRPGEDSHWELASADCEIMRVTGRGVVIEASALIGIARWELDHDAVLTRASLAREQAARVPHYLPARDGSDDWETRVEVSAPVFRLPYDDERPGELDPDPARELERIRRIVAPRDHGDDVDGVSTWCELAYGHLDSGTRARIDGTKDGTTISQWADNAYLQASVDPGVARWQGLSGTLEREPEPTDAHHHGLAVALLPTFHLLGPGVQPGSSRELDEAERFYEEEIGGYADLRDAVRDFPTLEDGSRWELRLLAVPLPWVRESPQDVPQRPSLLALESAWNAVTIDRWSASVGIDRVVPRGEVSFVQTAPVPRTLHPGPPDAPPGPMIAGYSPTHGRHVLPARAIASTAASIGLEVRLGDWLGRWGEPGDVVVGRPARPPVPAPRGRTFFVPGPVAADGAATSSGTVRLDLTAPWPVGPGSLPLTELRVHVPREPAPRTLALSAADVVGGVIARVVELAAPPTVPGQVIDEEITLRSVDSEGRLSAAVTLASRVVDPRPIRPPVVGPRLIAATRRTHSPTVTVTLAITAAPHARAYRVLVAGETVLRAKLGLPAPDAGVPRAERAAQVQRAMPGRDRRASYSWASTEAFAVKNGTAYATIELPAGTDGVVFARAVAVTTIPGNPPTETVSTPFEATRPVAIVVPRSDFPPVPDLRVEAGDEGTARVTVRVSQPPTSALASLQIEGEPPARIEARLVEHLGADVPPAFWPEVAPLVLEPRADDPSVHEATATVRGAPWLRTAVAACVRYPAEPTLAAGATQTASEVRATGLQHERIPSPWGPFSTPAWIDSTGPLPTVAFAEDAGDVQVTVDGLPELPPAAPPWTLQLLSGTTVLAPAPGAAGAVVPAAAGLTLTPVPGQQYAVQLRDPFGAAHGVTPVPTP